MDEPRKSIIPQWAGKTAAWVNQNFGFDEAALEGAFAAALHTERERCATLIERRDGEIPDRQEIAAAIRRGDRLRANGKLEVGDA